MSTAGRGPGEGAMTLPLAEFGRDVTGPDPVVEGFVDDLMERRFAAVQGIPPELIAELVDAYIPVMQLPNPSPAYIDSMYDPRSDELVIRPESDRELHWHTYRTRVDRPGKPGGLTNRSLESQVLREYGVTKREADDPKEYFHFTPDMLPELETIHAANGWGPIPTEVREFLELAAPIHERASEIMRGCFEAMEHHVAFDGVSKALLADRDWRNASPMRLLAYHTDGEGDMLGQLHRDKGTATLAIDESHSGLRVSTAADVVYDGEKGGYVLLNKNEAGDDKNMQLVERIRGQAAFFTADGFRRETGVDHPAVEPTYHDIIRVDGERYSDEIARYALILFFNPPSGIFSTKVENHGDTNRSSAA